MLLQVKLFKEWFHAFTEEERTRFLDNLKEKDSEFYAKINAEEVEAPESPCKVSIGVEKEEVTSPESSSCSPLSSQSQPAEKIEEEVKIEEVTVADTSEIIQPESNPEEGENEVSQL